MVTSTSTSTSTRTRTDARGAARGRAELALAGERLRAPASTANIARNARAEVGRNSRWGPARDALWRLLGPYLADGSRVAILGAGNGDTIPLGRIAERAREVALIDLDEPAIRAARRRQPRGHRRRITTVEHDITHGAADGIAAAAARGTAPAVPVVPEAPLPGAPYDVVIGDLFYSQLLHPALVDLNIPAALRRAFVRRYAPVLTRAVVARLEISAPNGTVVHIHDPIAWWPGHPQPVTLELILEVAKTDPAAAITLAVRGTGPRHTDPRPALRELSIPIHATELWRWPFAASVDYLACGTITRRPGVPVTPAA
jgi:hypothetical protein